MILGCYRIKKEIKFRGRRKRERLKKEATKNEARRLIFHVYLFIIKYFFMI